MFDGEDDNIAHVSCPVCESLSVFENQLGGGNLFRCIRCRHCFYDITTVKFEEYGTDYFSVKHRNWFANPNLRLYKTIMSYIEENLPNRSLIDVGCGNGSFLKWIRSQNNVVSLAGIDLLSNKPATGIEFIHGDATNIGLPRKFDYVISLAVVEHIRDVRSFLGTLSSLCSYDGNIIIMTLNENSILYQIAKILNRLGVHTPYERLYSSHHIHHFNVSSLKELILGSGLTIVRHLFHNIPIAAVDIPYTTALMKFVMRSGVLGAFALGSLLGQRTYLQTLICKPSRG
jgi:SAM-dependent methyltransferase